MVVLVKRAVLITALERPKLFFGIHRKFLFTALASVAIAGCAHRQSVVNLPAPPPVPSPAPAAAPPAAPGHYIEQGIASWYGVPFNGHRTSDGEIYDMFQFTAAHRTLPFGAIVLVTNLSNGRQTEVRINDRGPFVQNRIIDLSYVAAEAIGMIGTGTAPVRLEVVAGPNPDAGFFAVQVGAFLDEQNAEALRERLSTRFAPVTIQSFDLPGGTYYRVRVGRMPSEAAARQLAAQLRAEGQLAGFVVRLDN